MVPGIHTRGNRESMGEPITDRLPEYLAAVRAKNGAGADLLRDEVPA
jgi:hypothetical protein